MKQAKMKIKIKRFSPRAVIPCYAHDGDAGLDLFATEIQKIDDDKTLVRFGVGFEIPRGFVGLVFPRSSIFRTGNVLTNSVGVIDSGFRGEISAVFQRVSTERVPFEVGEKCAQIVFIPYPEVSLCEVEELAQSNRGIGGYGSTGRGMNKRQSAAQNRTGKASKK